MSAFSKAFENLFTFYPMIPVTICMMIGIWIGHLCVDILDALPLVGGVGVFLLLALPFGKWQQARSLFILLSFFCWGAAVAVFEEKGLDCSLPAGRTLCRGTIVEEPTVTEDYIRADIILTGGVLQGHKVRVYLHKDEGAAPVTVGDGIEMEARLWVPQSLGNGNFNYPLYLKSHGFVATGSAYDGHWHGAKADWDRLTMMQRVRLRALLLRHSLIERYKDLSLMGDELAVVSAMTLGDKSAIGKELRQTYAATGTSHILALSGMHLGIIYALLLFLTFGRSGGFVRMVLLIVAVWAFVVLVGLSPSVVRAAVMLTVYSLVALSTRQPTSANTLALTAILMLSVSPLSLFDLGFQLSFVSVLAIVVFAVPISRLIPTQLQLKIPGFRYVWQLAVMSTVAQLATAPLSIYYFGQTSAYFLLANFVVIPTATIILYASVAVLVLVPLPWLCQPLAFVLGVVVEKLNAVLAWIAALPGATLSGLHISGLQFVLLQVVVVALLWATAIVVRVKRERF